MALVFDGQAGCILIRGQRYFITGSVLCGRERGDYLEYSRNTYHNTNNLSRDFQEYKGSRQGHKHVAGNIKAYINPCLEAANSSNLVFNTGPHCVSAFCIADDKYVLADDPRKLQNRTMQGGTDWYSARTKQR